MSSKILFTGKTHTTNGSGGAGHSSDGFLDIKLPQPHPAAEDLFGVAWSACYMGAIEVAASKKKITLPPEVAVDAQIDLHLGNEGFFLTARLDVSLPGLDRGVAKELIEAAHGICPYSKAMHGNIAVETNLV
jgi:Ohr subfamily peroxiredoxin